MMCNHGMDRWEPYNWVTNTTSDPQLLKTPGLEVCEMIQKEDDDITIWLMYYDTVYVVL